MDSPTSEASFDFVDSLAAECGGGTLEVGENGGNELGAANQQGQIKSGQLLENVVVLQHQMLLKMEEYQKEQRHNQTEICVQIGELKKLVGPVAASALTERRADIDQALRANVAATEKEHRKLLTDHEALRAEVAEMKRLQKMQEQRQAQMLLRLDELFKAFTGGSVLLERVNSFVDLAAHLKELKQFIMKTVKERSEGGTEAVKEGTKDGTEAVKKRTEDGTESVKKRTEDGTESVKKRTEDGTESVKKRTEDGTESVKKGTEDETEAIKKRTEGRVLLSQQQIQMLERAFAEMACPSASDCENLAQSFCLSPLLVKIWFQNRRAMARRSREQEMMRGRRMDGEVAGEGVGFEQFRMRTAKEGTEDGTEAVKERSEGGTKAALNRFNATAASSMDMKHNPFGTLDSTLFNSGHFITSCNGYHPMPLFNQAYSAAPFGQMLPPFYTAGMNGAVTAFEKKN
uniref:Homeobox domain-containing protein n=1 Tax=Globodera pallida TaxID=36090 RepID=A0A183C501_GLOPA